MNEILTYAGKRLSDFGCYWDGSQIYVRPQKIIEKYDIMGRSGDLLYTDTSKFSNIIIPFNCFIKENFRENFSALSDFLNNTDGYQVLRTTEEPDTFRQAVFHSAIVPNMGAFNHYGQFTLEFDCMPQLWIDDGCKEIQLANGINTVYNPTYSKAYPIFIVNSMSSATGRITLGQTFTSGRGLLTVTRNTSVFPLYIEMLPQSYACYTSDGTANYSYVKPNTAYTKSEENYIKSGQDFVRVDGFSDIKMLGRYYRL